jgi:hypothetical protein
MQVLHCHMDIHMSMCMRKFGVLDGEGSRSQDFKAVRKL